MCLPEGSRNGHVISASKVVSASNYVSKMTDHGSRDFSALVFRLFPEDWLNQQGLLNARDAPTGPFSPWANSLGEGLGFTRVRFRFRVSRE